MDDLFLARLDQRLERRNRMLKNNIHAWMETLDALGWCVAIMERDEGGVQLSPNAVAELERRGLVGVSWGRLGEALRAVPAAWRPVDNAAMQVWAFVQSAGVEETKAGPALTPRETEVLRWLREGKTNAEIAIILGCSRRTVEGHGLRLYRKLGIHTRADLYLLGVAAAADEEHQTHGTPS